jgi:iron complex transport system ATP-binding protein
VSALRFEHVSLALRGRPILTDIDVAVAPGELVALVGPNGAGKSMLLRCAIGLERPTGGRVVLGGAAVATLAPRTRAAGIAWLPQHLIYHEPLTALEVVVSARYRFTERPRAAHAAARRALDDVGAGAYAARPVTALSGGQRQRVALAALLVQETPVVLLDEPANHLDPLQQIECYRVLGTLARRGLAIVCVTHDVNLLRPVGVPARIVGLAGGRVRFDAAYDDADLPVHLSALFDVHMAVLTSEQRRVIVPGY